jgi:hypothetical protein
VLLDDHLLKILLLLFLFPFEILSEFELDILHIHLKLIGHPDILEVLLLFLFCMVYALIEAGQLVSFLTLKKG